MFICFIVIWFNFFVYILVFVNAIIHEIVVFFYIRKIMLKYMYFREIEMIFFVFFFDLFFVWNEIFWKHSWVNSIVSKYCSYIAKYFYRDFDNASTSRNLKSFSYIAQYWAIQKLVIMRLSIQINAKLIFARFLFIVWFRWNCENV